MAIKIDSHTLEQACKEIIETILFCLPDAYKGTVYRIGPPPDIIARRVTSGVMDATGEAISWGLPEKSDYNPPGKPWLEYRDEKGRTLEAMGWCVERQKSWTAEDPENDIRSTRIQTEGLVEDYHHMEPVLVRKEDLYENGAPSSPYPENENGEVLWRRSDYVVVAVIKIHFRPNTIKIRSHETSVIKRLSRTLGTELLSYQLRHHSLEAMQRLELDKLNSCNILADTLRNATAKSGLIFSLIKLELGSLRKQWEALLLKESDKNGMRAEAVSDLNRLLSDADGINGLERDELIQAQDKFLRISMPPERGEKWVRMRIESKWRDILENGILNNADQDAVWNRIEALKRSLYLGKDPEIVAACRLFPEDLKKEWVELIYRDTDNIDGDFLERVLRVLENPDFILPDREKAIKSLSLLKTLIHVMDKLEEDTNQVLRKVLNGNHEDVLNQSLRLVKFG